MFFANAVIFEEGVETAKNIAESWDNVWDKVFLFFDPSTGNLNLAGQNLYGHLCYVGLVFASGLLVFYAVKQFKQLTDGNVEQYFLGLFMPLMVVILLSNDGFRLAGITYEMRDFIDRINIGVLESTVEGLNLQETYRNLQQEMAVRAAAPNLNSQCEMLTGQQLSDCLLTALAQAESMGATSTTGSPSPQNTSSSNPLVGPALTVGIGSTGNSLLASTGENIVFSTLNAFQSGYQQILEGSLLLTGLLGPIAVGGSLLPIGSSVASLAFVTGFFTIGFAKLTFNIIAGLSAVAASMAGPSDPLPLATITGLFAPMLATGLAAGGGMAVWQAITGAAEGAIEVVGKAASMIL